MNTPINIDADKTSDFIISCFQKVREHGSAVRGSIHSVYKHTVNLQFGDNLMALQCSGSPASPVSLILPLSGSQMDDLKLRQLTPCFLYGDSIEIHDRDSLLLIHLKPNTSIYDSGTPSISNCEDLIGAITQQIQNSNRGGFSSLLQEDSHESDMILAGAAKHLRQSEKLFESGKSQEAAEHLAEIIGLGTGLTPSGDDFLCGVLAILHSTQGDKNTFFTTLQKSIQQNLYRTNDISGEFLRSASNGRYSEPVVQLFQAADRGETDLQKYTENFLNIGHSSGIDTLCGMLWCLNHRPA